MPTDSALDHVLTAMKGQVDAIDAHEAGARTGRAPEDVHQMRVAVRRLLSSLRASRPLFDPRWADGLRPALKSLGTVPRGVRDPNPRHPSLASRPQSPPA